MNENIKEISLSHKPKRGKSYKIIKLISITLFYISSAIYLYYNLYTTFFPWPGAGVTFNVYTVIFIEFSVLNIYLLTVVFIVNFISEFLNGLNLRLFNFSCLYVFLFSSLSKSIIGWVNTILTYKMSGYHSQDEIFEFLIKNYTISSILAAILIVTLTALFIVLINKETKQLKNKRLN